MGSDWELKDTDVETETGGDDDDDLEIVDELLKPARTPSSIAGRSTESRPVDTRETGYKKKKSNSSGRSSGTNTIVLSEDDDDDLDEFNDGEAAYNMFKNRKNLKRKRASRGKDSAVGKRQKLRNAEKTKKRRYKVRDYGDVSSEDELMEDTLPDYLQKRRSEFDKRKENLKEAGLKLPPDFEEVEFSDDERLESLEEKPGFKNVKPSRKYEDIQLPYSLGLIPAPIAQWLREYQVAGAAFLHELFVYQKGGILGDDMGLGKTVQVIAFLAAAYGKTGDERDNKRMRKMRRSPERPWYPRTLIICPGTLIQNWRAELEQWGWWHVEVYHGEGKEAALQSAKSGRMEILITTYTTYRLNRSALNVVEWDCVVADECHVIKERKSETTQALNEINALCRIGLTGTAIQNKYEELWTLLNWSNPGRFGPVTTWKTSICEPLKIGQSHDATVHQLSKARKTAKKLVQNLLPSFFLRRLKTLIAHQLPKKSDRVVFCPLTPTQADAYENFLDSNIVQYIKGASDMCDCGSGKKAGWCCRMYLPQGGKWQSYVFPAILNLQKLSNHLAIAIPQGTDPKEKQDKDLELLQIAVPDQWQELYRNRGSILNFSNPEFCGKWKVLKKLLKWWHSNGDKVLIFSHNVRLLKMLQMLFNHTSYNVSYLDGAMTYEDRAKVVDDFNSDPQQFVFLISTRAGGVGLNITSANKVVVVDPNWNPSYDLQAQDRAYRIGQHRDVEVFRLVSAGTIEEIVYARQIYKQQQANIGYNASVERRYFKGVQEKKDQKGEIFGLANMFEYQNDNIVLRDIVNKTNVAESKAGVSVIDVDLEDDKENDADEEGDADADADELDKSFKSTSDEDEGGAMSQIAALLVGEEPAAGSKSKPKTKKKQNRLSLQAKKHDPIQAILSNAGVEYSHENSEVVGSSKVEERLSRRAELAGNDIAVGEEQVFAEDEGGGSQQVQSQNSTGTGSGSGGGRSSTGVGGRGKGARGVKFKYHPPQDVMKRQFCSMARRYGFPDATEFALVVEGMTQAQRRMWLDRWYRERREALFGSGT